MKEHPILFSAPTIRALLSGEKTQTRRVVRWPKWATPEEHGDTLAAHGGLAQYEDGRPARTLTCPFGVPGDRLWVRETWRQTFDPYQTPVMEYAAGGTRLILSGGGITHGEHSVTSVLPRWRPSIHMPRWASRITLEVTRVRVEHVQAISEDDADAEGLFNKSGLHMWDCGYQVFHPDHTCGCGDRSPQEEFARLWDSLNAKRPGCSWDANPWTWVVEFRRLQP